MHPRSEAIPDCGTSISWNKGEHRRKFLKCSGVHLDKKQKRQHEEIVFWGEWEPESKVVGELEPGLKQGPRYVYEPYYVIPKPACYKILQNTDPFVFGSAFRYSLCQQPSHPSLRNFEEGSVILFGSHIDGDFALDTVFVVSDDYVDYSPRDYGSLLQQVDETYKIVTVNPILTQMGDANSKTSAGKNISGTLRSYRGATCDKPVDGMFSFFPCQAYTEDSLGFARPTIRMRGLISDNQTQGIKITECNGGNDIRNHWKAVVDQVTRKCDLGILAEMPKERKSNL